MMSIGFKDNRAILLSGSEQEPRCREVERRRQH